MDLGHTTYDSSSLTFHLCATSSGRQSITSWSKWSVEWSGLGQRQPVSLTASPLPTQNQPEKVKYAPQTYHMGCPALSVSLASPYQQSLIRAHLKPSPFFHPDSFPLPCMALESPVLSVKCYNKLNGLCLFSFGLSLVSDLIILVL